jgi:diguanylate cyclase (GGDEF)-like protein
MGNEMRQEIAAIADERALPRERSALLYIDGLETENEELRRRVKLYEAVINNFPGGILLTDADLRVVLCNKQQRELLQYPDELFANGMPTLQQLFLFNAERGEYGPGNPESHVAMKMEQVRKSIPHSFERARPNGQVVEIRGVPLPEGGFVTSYTDVTENRRNAALIAELAVRDPLTGLGNRNHLKDAFAQFAARARRGEGFALHYIDLDKFKPINDRFGHETGDKILQEVARRLKHTIRETDCAVRVGGDEFIILQSDVGDFANARDLGQRLFDQLCGTYVIGGLFHELGACIGISLSTSNCIDMEEMMRNADRALYACKENGRGRFLVHQCHLADACPLHTRACEC